MLTLFKDTVQGRRNNRRLLTCHGIILRQRLTQTQCVLSLARRASVVCRRWEKTPVRCTPTPPSPSDHNSNNTDCILDNDPCSR